MAAIKSKNTKPEVRFRSLLHKEGFRFRLHSEKLPGKPDVVLPKYNTAIFVNGCFWHGHENCKHFRLPKSKTQWWKEKIEATKIRDQKKTKLLQDLGWDVVTVWECEDFCSSVNILKAKLISDTLKSTQTI